MYAWGHKLKWVTLEGKVLLGQQRIRVLVKALSGSIFINAVIDNHILSQSLHLCTSM